MPSITFEPPRQYGTRQLGALPSGQFLNVELRNEGVTLVANESCFSRNTSRSYRSVELMEVGQTDASFVRLQVAEVKTTDALKRMDFETSVAPTEASKYNSLTGLGRKHRSKFAHCLLVQRANTSSQYCQ